MTFSSGDVLAAVLALVAFVAWLVRLEARQTRADERHNDLLERHNRLRDDFIQYVGGPTRTYHRRLPSAEGDV